MSGETFEYYSRDPLECLKALWSDPDFVNDLITEPERHYADEDMTVRLYHDMHTGKWWWAIQVRELEFGSRFSLLMSSSFNS